MRSSRRRRFESFGRDHALQRIDLYPVKMQAPSSHNRYSRWPKLESAAANQTTSRLRTAINLLGRQPPHRRRGKLNELLLDLERGSFWNDAIFNESPQRDRQLTCQSNNADLTAPLALVAEAFAPPEG